MAVVLALAALLAYRSVPAPEGPRPRGCPRRPICSGSTPRPATRGPPTCSCRSAGLDPHRGRLDARLRLAMLAADYRDPDGRLVAEGLLVEPGRADLVPAFADLATAALYLGRRRGGRRRHLRQPGRPLAVERPAARGASPSRPATSRPASSRWPPPPPPTPGWPAPWRSRATWPAASGATRPRPAPPTQAALAVSKLHPRATYGLAKLALAAQDPARRGPRATRQARRRRPGHPGPGAGPRRALPGRHRPAQRRPRPRPGPTSTP